MDPARQLGLSAPSGEGKRKVMSLEAVLGQPCKAVGVFERVETMGYDSRVAGEFALERKTTVNKEKRWVQGEDCKTHLQCEVDPIVAAAEVFALMKDNLVKLGFGELGEESLCDEKPR